MSALISAVFVHADGQATTLSVESWDAFHERAVELIRDSASPIARIFASDGGELFEFEYDWPGLEMLRRKR